ncbi:type II toxin-antitoxin system PemK/MazF family toxin [Paenibacillus sp. CN-4]|uniref:type II toxin-antitoxin system PemK/MazF family toxin n=1 Tax=Paenibacillus nanchangensis TaxID=3348343 RepID=UPI00397CF8C6
MTIPKRGDLIWLNFNPQSGHEQAGRRPAIVLSEQPFNDLTGFAVVCPITNASKEYAFEVPIPDGFAVKGVVLTDQLRSLDYRARKFEVAGTVPVHSDFMESVMRNVRSILV